VRVSSSSAILILTPLQDHIPCSSTVVPFPPAGLAWPFEPGQFAGLTTPYADGNGHAGQYFGFTSTVGAMS
jgi:hypothetical protein